MIEAVVGFLVLFLAAGFMGKKKPKHRKSNDAHTKDSE